MRYKKAQSSLSDSDKPMNFSWLIVILIVGFLVLYTWGVLDINKLSLERINFPSGLYTPDFKIKEGNLSLVIINTKGQNLEYVKVKIPQCSDNPYYMTPDSGKILLKGETARLNIKCDKEIKKFDRKVAFEFKNAETNEIYSYGEKGECGIGCPVGYICENGICEKIQEQEEQKSEEEQTKEEEKQVEDKEQENCSANFTTTPWSEWINASDCVSNKIQQKRNATKYDVNNCPDSLDKTVYETREINCNSTNQQTEMPEDIIELNSCSIINKSGTYELTKNLINDNSKCLSFGSNNINIDCKGFKITGKPALVFYGGGVSAENISISNCQIETKTHISISGLSLKKISFNNVNLSGSSTYRFGVDTSSEIELKDVNFNNIYLYFRGIVGKHKFDNVKITVSGCPEFQYSALYIRTQHSTFKNIDIDTQCQVGIHLEHADNNILENIKIRNAELGGLYLEESENNLINNLETINIPKGILMLQSFPTSNAGTIIKNSKSCDSEVGLECSFSPPPLVSETDRNYPSGTGNRFNNVKNCSWTNENYEIC